MSYDLFLIILSVLVTGQGFLVFCIYNNLQAYKTAKNEYEDVGLMNEAKDTIKVNIFLLVLVYLIMFYLMNTHLEYVRKLFGI